MYRNSHGHAYKHAMPATYTNAHIHIQTHEPHTEALTRMQTQMYTYAHFESWAKLLCQLAKTFGIFHKCQGSSKANFLQRLEVAWEVSSKRLWDLEIVEVLLRTHTSFTHTQTQIRKHTQTHKQHFLSVSICVCLSLFPCLCLSICLAVSPLFPSLTLLLPPTFYSKKKTLAYA